jgi:LmbE family N-acetylglucosaminyl deacetylase
MKDFTIMTKEYPIPASAMSIQAHPDDQDFTIAGTLAHWAKAGCRVVSVVITSGDSGSNDTDCTELNRAELARLREAEQSAANAVLGVQETVFLHYQDGVLQPTMELRKDLTRLIRRHRPEVVICGDPTARFYGDDYINHPDHRAAADAACDAVFPSAETRMIFTDLLDEGLEPHKVKRLYISGSEKSNTWVDISDTIELKIQALQQHVSQVGGWKELPEEMRRWAASAGEGHDLAYAEGFRVMVLAED